LRLLLFQYQI